MPLLLEAGIRGGAIALFLVLSALLIRDAKDRSLAWLGVLFSCSAAARTLATYPYFKELAGPWALPVAPLCVGSTAAFWLFAKALFDDDFRWRASLAAIWAGTTGAGILILLARKLGVELPGIGPLFGLLELLFAGSALWFSWNGFSADLLEPRRRARFAFVSLTSLYVIVLVTTELTFYAHGAPSIVSTLNAVGLVAVSTSFALMVLGLRDREIFEGAESAIAPLRLRDAAWPASEPAEPSELALLERLNRMMEAERAYRYERLTIGSLAARLQVPEYQLRRLINRRLGHKNFNAYLNGWRLAEARLALTDASQLEVPISTIALDAGFQSLGPFNRAFKAMEGVTPSEYRQRALTP